MMNDNKLILQKGNAAITAGNHEEFLIHCTDDTKWTFLGDKILNGKAAVRAWMSSTYKEPPKFNVENLIAEGDYVTAIGKIKLKDEQGHLAEYDYCDVWRFKDGKIAELKAFVIKNKS